jgi:hypothetical protein
VSRELRVRAGRHRADLFIAHNLGALPAAARAAFRQRARLGFDAEDFHSGQLSGAAPSGLRAATLSIEQRFIPACDYLTASAPGIADAYQAIAYRAPTVVLNVSSRQDRAGLTLRDPAEGPLRMYWFSQTIGPGRGLEDVVRAMGMMRVPVELHLRGTWAAGYEASLRRLMQECAVPNGRVVAYGPGAPDEMVRLAASFDIGLALEPGHTANNAAAVSNKLFTYLMAGLAVIASRTPGQSWLLDRVPAAGWTYHPGSALELSTLIAALTADRSRLRAARIAAWEAAGARFCWEVEQRRFLEAVSFALESPRRDAVESAMYPDARLERLR